MRFGLPITENLSTQLAYNYSKEEYEFRDNCDFDGNGIPDPTCSISSAIAAAIQDSPWVKSSVSGSIIYNTIDDLKNPHEGIFTNITTEFAGLGGDADFASLTARGAYYHTLSEELNIVGLLSAGGGHVRGWGSTIFASSTNSRATNA